MKLCDFPVVIATDPETLERFRVARESIEVVIRPNAPPISANWQDRLRKYMAEAEAKGYGHRG